MALRKCKECGAEVSTKAESCPKCGASQKPKQYGCGSALVVIGVVSLLLWLFVAESGNKPRQSESRTSSAFSADTSPEAQAKRSNLIQELVDAGLFHKVETSGSTARVYVTPAFMQQSMDAKRNFISAVAAWHYTHTGSSHVRLIDYRTDKTVGSFLAEAGGLSMR